MALVKSGRVQNLGDVTYENVDKQGRLHINVLTKGKVEKGGGERGRVEFSRWIKFWFAPSQSGRGEVHIRTATSTCEGIQEAQCFSIPYPALVVPTSCTM